MNKTEGRHVNTQSSRVLWNKLRGSRAYRRAFAASQFKRLVPFQIGALRRERGWSQKELARACSLTQGVISRAEDPDYGNLTVNTLLRIADGFDVAFVGKFIPFSELETLVDKLSDKQFVPSFQQEEAQRLQDVAETLEEELAKTLVQPSNNVISIDRQQRELAANEQRSAAVRLSDLRTGQSEGGLTYAAVGGSSSQGVSLH
jgi:transcriptional regulator with XRE-family HTH domain